MLVVTPGVKMRELRVVTPGVKMRELRAPNAPTGKSNLVRN